MASTINQVGYAHGVDTLKFEATIIEGTITPSCFNSEVSNIIDYRFNNCSGLEYVEFPAVETIGDGAFQDCISLETVVFQSATNLGSDVFAGCASLHEVRFDAITTIPASFSTSSIWTSVSFGAVTTLPNSRSNNFGLFFSNAKSTLQSVYFNGVTSSIPSYYFSNFTALKTVEFQNASTDVGSYAFISCYNLETISIPNITGNIGRNAFTSCSTLISIDTPLVSGTIGINAFYNCRALSSINMPLVTILNSGCFEQVAASAIYFPNVTSMVGSRHFAWCSNLKLVSFEALTTLAGIKSNSDNTVFIGTDTIEDVYFKNVSIIGTYYFASYSNLKHVKLPAAQTISARAFRNCSALTEIELPCVQNIAAYAFSACTSLSKVKFMWASKFNGNVFTGCTNLDTVYLLGSSMAVLSGASNNFTSTKITSITGSIYVPTSLLATYQANGSWKIYSTQFVAYNPPTYSTHIISQMLSNPSATTIDIFDTPVSTATVQSVSLNAIATVLGFSNGFYNISVPAASDGTIIEGWALPNQIVDWFPPGT